MQRRVAYFVLLFGLLGIMLVVLGAVAEYPVTVVEDINNKPLLWTTWADANISLRPTEFRYYELDRVSQNCSIIYVKVERLTAPVIFSIKGLIGWGFNHSDTYVQLGISPIGPYGTPFEYFFTPPKLYVWWFFFNNTSYDTTANLTVKIISYGYNLVLEGWVTHIRTPLDHSFAYAGVACLIASVTPPAYYLYKTRKLNKKKPWWHDSEAVHEAEEHGRLR